MKKKIVFKLFGAFLVCVGIILGTRNLGNKSLSSDLLMANVEALTQNDASSSRYSYTHIACYGGPGNSTTVTGQRAICWSNPIGGYKTCHSHECQKDCSYRPY